MQKGFLNALGMLNAHRISTGERKWERPKDPKKDADSLIISEDKDQSGTDKQSDVSEEGENTSFSLSRR